MKLNAYIYFFLFCLLLLPPSCRIHSLSTHSTYKSVPNSEYDIKMVLLSTNTIIYRSNQIFSIDVTSIPDQVHEKWTGEWEIKNNEIILDFDVYTYDELINLCSLNSIKNPLKLDVDTNVLIPKTTSTFLIYGVKCEKTKSES